MKYFITIFFIAFVCLNVSSQNIDTLYLKEKKGVSLKRYIKILTESKRHLSYNEMDSIDKNLIQSKKNMYVILQNENDIKILEGIYSANNSMLVGNVVLYYINGEIKKDVFINDEGVICNCNFENEFIGIYYSDSPCYYGNLKFYSKKGNLIKERNYSCECNSNKKIIYMVIKTIKYRKNNKIERVKNVILFREGKALKIKEKCR